MDFLVRDATDRQTIVDYLNRLPEGKAFEVSIRLHKEKRSNPQNNLYHSWLNIICKETKNDHETVHKALAKMFLGVEVSEFGGQRIAKVKSTTTLNTEEFTEYLNNIEAFAATELGIILPHPDDRLYNMLTNE